MSKVRVLAGQTLTDIAVKHLGSAEGVFALAAANDLAITDQLDAGQELTIGEPVDRRALKVYRDNKTQPAANLMPDAGEGIGVWIINDTFVVQPSPQ